MTAQGKETSRSNQNAPTTPPEEDRPSAELGGLASRVPFRLGGSDEGALFDTARRGYNRSQVEQHVAELTAAADEDRRRAAAAEQELRAVQSRVLELEREATATASESGFGSRVERLLRVAEQEAAEIRDKASEDATGLLERARAEAETHRHQTEEDLNARAAKLDQDMARREATLNEREQEIDDKRAAASAEVERIRAAAERDAQQEREKAQQRAREMIDEADRSARARRDAAEAEVARLAKVRDDVRAEMAELHRLLGSELDAGTGDQPEPRPA